MLQLPEKDLGWSTGRRGTTNPTQHSNYCPIDPAGSPWAPSTIVWNTHPKLCAAPAAWQPKACLCKRHLAMLGNLASLHAPENGSPAIGDLPSTQPSVPDANISLTNTLWRSERLRARPTLASSRIGWGSEQHWRRRGRHSCKLEDYTGGNKPRSNCYIRMHLVACPSHCSTVLGLRLRGKVHYMYPPLYVVYCYFASVTEDRTSSNFVVDPPIC